MISEAGAPPALGDYAGRYDLRVWSGELSVLPWGSDLVTLLLPSEVPAASMEVWRNVGGANFRTVRDDKTLGPQITFVRAADGRVVGFKSWSGTYHRMN